MKCVCRALRTQREVAPCLPPAPTSLARQCPRTQGLPLGPGLSLCVARCALLARRSLSSAGNRADRSQSGGSRATRSWRSCRRARSGARTGSSRRRQLSIILYSDIVVTQVWVATRNSQVAHSTTVTVEQTPSPLSTPEMSSLEYLSPLLTQHLRGQFAWRKKRSVVNEILEGKEFRAAQSLLHRSH